MSNGKGNEEFSELLKHLRFGTLVQLQNLSEEKKPEILLLKAGFSRNEIADLLSKSYDAVKQAILRG